jgi:hypothetical protein
MDGRFSEIITGWFGVIKLLYGVDLLWVCCSHVFYSICKRLILWIEPLVTWHRLPLLPWGSPLFNEIIMLNKTYHFNI